jgi:ketosteroid isomerase-like protein
MAGMRTVAVVLGLAAAGCAPTGFLPDAMEPSVSLAAAETAFAAHSVREDMRAAFLAHFADDGVFVRNAWRLANAHLRGRDAPPIVLDWRPAYVEVAASGDFGLSTGPWKITSNAQPDAAPAFGQFVSIWKREASGPWKVAVDLGIDHPQAALWDRPLEAVVVRSAGSPIAGGVAAAEARFARAVQSGGLRRAYGAEGAENLRFYRSGTNPILGRGAALASPAMSDDKWAFTLERVETARSGDLGYARGSYAAADAPARALGVFMRVWRLEAGEWRIALDVTNPVN